MAKSFVSEKADGAVRASRNGQNANRPLPRLRPASEAQGGNSAIRAMLAGVQLKAARPPSFSVNCRFAFPNGPFQLAKRAVSPPETPRFGGPKGRCPQQVGCQVVGKGGRYRHIFLKSVNVRVCYLRRDRAHCGFEDIPFRQAQPPAFLFVSVCPQKSGCARRVGCVYIHEHKPAGDFEAVCMFGRPLFNHFFLFGLHLSRILYLNLQSGRPETFGNSIGNVSKAINSFHKLSYVRQSAGKHTLPSLALSFFENIN